MRIGVYLGSYLPQEGGGFVFEETLICGLLNSKTNNEYVIFYTGNSTIKSNNKIVFESIKQTLAKKIFKKILRFLISILPFHIPLLDNQAKSELNKAIKKYSIDLVWFPTPIYERVDTPYIYTLWDFGHRLYPYFPEVSASGQIWGERESYYQNVLPNASVVITGAEVGKKDIVNMFQIPAKSIKVVPLPVSSYITINKLNQLADKNKFPKRYLFYPAQFWAHKNHIVLLLALKILIDEYRINFHLILTGSDKGNKKYIEQKVGELNLKKYVHFMGFVSQDILISLYKNAFALVFPTFFGPDNLPPLEAFSLGCPVLASNIPGAEEQLGDAALLFNPIKEREIANLVKLLKEKPGLRRKLTTAGLKKVRNLTPEKYVTNIDKIIDEFHKYQRCWKDN